MSAAVRWATAADAGDLALLLREIAAHYRQPEISVERSGQAAAAWLAASTERHFALAHVDGTVAGLASVSIAYPGADLERLLFLKELFVRDGLAAALSARRCCGSSPDTASRKAWPASTSRPRTGTPAHCASTVASARHGRSGRSSCGSTATG